MKISQSLLFAFAAAQDRWGSTDYYSFNYGFGNDGGRQDAGLAFGLSENPVQGGPQTVGTYAGVESVYLHNNESAHYKDQLHFNGLLCWMCDFRLDLATEAETEDCDDNGCQNAYGRCLRNGMLMRCRGEQRTCMFEERRRHGVVYSICTGCKQTDACVAHWRRNQRFTLPFMNFGDMSLRNLPTSTGNTLDGDKDQLPNHRPIYVDDECSTYQETRSEAAWRKTVYNPVSGTSGGDISSGTASNAGINNEVYPMGWQPLLNTSGNPSSPATTGSPFSTNGSNLVFTGHRVNLGLSYSKFAYDGASDLQLNAQLSQWESTCRWCCHARPDTVCNIEMKEINSSPFSTKCGNAHGTRRSETVDVHPDDATSYGSQSNVFRYVTHPLATSLKKFIEAIDSTTAFATVNSQNQRAYWGLLDSMTAEINGLTYTNTVTGSAPIAVSHFACSLSNAQWDSLNGGHASSETDLATMEKFNRRKIPQGIHNKFRFFQPFNIAQSDASFFNPNQLSCDDQDMTTFGNYCTSDGDCGTGECTTGTGSYETGPRFWMQMFQRTPQYDLSHWYTTGATFTAKFPAVGEGRNSAGMDKFAGRGNKSRWTLSETTLRSNPELQHFYQQQTDMTSQENRDFFDGRARDAATSYTDTNTYLKRFDNQFWTNK